MGLLPTGVNFAFVAIEAADERRGARQTRLRTGRGRERGVRAKR